MKVDKKLNVCVTAEEKEKIKKLSKLHNRKMSDYCRRILQREIEKEEKERKNKQLELFGE